MEFRELRLDNGLEIVAECNPQAHTMALGFFVKTGSRDESADVAGVSHFLEHMAFKGTAKRSAAQVNRELDEMGSHANAQTGEERTVYYAALLPEYQQRAVELLSDIMRPALRQSDFDTEKQVIIEEICMYEDQPPYGANEKCMAAFFGPHPLGHSILGTVESIKMLSPEAMRRYFQQRYSPGNMVLVAAGRVDFDALTAQAQRTCGHWEPWLAPRDTSPARARPAFQVLRKEPSVQEYTVQASPGPAAESDDRFAARILATVLGDDSGSRLYWDLVDSGRADYAVMGAYEFQGTGVLMTFHCSTPELAQENLGRIHEIQLQAQRDGITDDELQRAKSKITSHIVLQSERPGNRLFAVGTNWLQRRQYLTTREIVAAYQDVSRGDVARVLARYPLTEGATVAIGPLEKLDAPA
jgi:predicted Zn-dependent peptidase